jgi:hypothetical protein
MVGGSWRGYLAFIAVGVMLSTLWTVAWSKGMEEQADIGYLPPMPDAATKLAQISAYKSAGLTAAECPVDPLDVDSDSGITREELRHALSTTHGD